jgi:hypothetical protein
MPPLDRLQERLKRGRFEHYPLARPGFMISPGSYLHLSQRHVSSFTHWRGVEAEDAGVLTTSTKPEAAANRSGSHA